MKFFLLLLLVIYCSFIFCACTSKAVNDTVGREFILDCNKTQNDSVDTSFKVIHLFVALCDNKYQGIVPVPANIGNGQNPATNLYWGCGYGISTFFRKSKSWQLEKTYTFTDSIVLQRLLFKHTKSNYYLVADAYNGKCIKKCTIDFFNSCSGLDNEVLKVNNVHIGIKGYASLNGYIGHNGLMDFSLEQSFKNKDGKKRDAIMLACISKKYFNPFIQQANANPLVWSTGFMSPEAYTLHDAIESYIKKEPAIDIRAAAANAYATYQKCSKKAATNLLVSGW
jgi:hypothetical protein